MMFEDVAIALPVRPNDLDSFGHVNYATVLEYMEAGRWAWLSHHHKMEQASTVLPVVSRLEIAYHRELRMEQVQVNTHLEPGEESPYYVFFKQTVGVVREGRSVTAVEARVRMVFMDAVKRTLTTKQAFLDSKDS
ncbi:MAG: acyl-CoA thioesterase [Aphanocapsa lilacina HA4352-LM1]|nr:acyl-CoA thioesterase [Aphanocapsa lilacina HA4352-LM1]